MTTKKEKEKPEFKSDKWIKFNYGEFICYGRTYQTNGQYDENMEIIPNSEKESMIACVQETGATSHFRYDNELITNIKYLK